MGQRAFETKLNVLLGRLLSQELGLRATSEHISRGSRPDVIVYFNGLKIVLEGSYSKADAEKDVKERIEKGLGDIGLALHYKEVFPSNLIDSELEERLRRSTFGVRLIIPEEVSGTLAEYLTHRKISPKWVTDWVDAKITDLTSIISEATQFLISEEDVERDVKEIEQKIDDFVSRLKSVDGNRQIAKKLYEIFYKLYGLSVGNYEEISELIYAQAALAILLSTTFYQSVRSEIGLEDVDVLCRRHGYRLGLKTGFSDILKIDYRPIYELAIQVVETLPDTASPALKDIVELAVRISSRRTLLRKDFSGKIYHRIVGDWAVRKNFATYFTTVPAAYLLAYLAVFTRTGVFGEFRKDFKVGDLACGSGTLLTAAYSALKDLYIYSKFGEEDIDLESFHKRMLEEGVWGIDALRYAVQIASTNLALQSPTTQVSRMNMFVVPLGVEKGEVVLGSLEFLKGRALPPVTAYFAENQSPKFLGSAEVASITGGEVPKELPKFDLIIMNPPFTRATGRGKKKRGGLFGFIENDSVRKNVLNEYKNARNAVRNELKPIVQKYFSIATLKRAGVEKEIFNIGQAGEGLLFLFLASKRVKEGGKIAFVLPKTLLTGVSWLSARCLLVDKFHLEHIVVSYDPKGGYNFSESTGLSEVLIVARKRRENEDAKEDEETRITVLLRKPTTSLEARALAFRILKAGDEEYLEVNGSRAYTYKVSRRRLVERLFNWGSLLAFPDPRLTKVSDEILRGSLFGAKIPLARLGDIATIGIDRHQFHDAFEAVSGCPPGSFPAVYGGEEEVRQRMFIEPNARILAKTVKTKKGEERRPGEELFKKFSSNLLIPDRIRVDTAHVTAIYCSEPVLANIFNAVRLKLNDNAENRLKALCVWLNTTWGILSILANRSETGGVWIRLAMTHWRLQPVLDVTGLDEEKVAALAAVFDKYSRRDLRRLPEQFNPANIDPVRRSIDEEFLKALGVDFEDEKLIELYGLIHRSLVAWIGE